MDSLCCALALLGGVIGAGFASGREIAHFFASHGPFAPAAVLAASLALAALFCRLPAQLERAGVCSLGALCRVRFGARLGRLCAALFALLSAVTGGTMLAACAELCALLLPLRHAYGLGLCVSLLLGTLLAARGLTALALPGAALCALLPVLLVRLLLAPAGEACFAPAAQLIAAGADGAVYAALNAAMLAGALPMLLRLSPVRRRWAAALFALFFGALLALAVATLARHRQAAMLQPLPFVSLSRLLGRGGYLLCAGAMLAAALSTLCAMLAALLRALPQGRGAPWLAAALCLFFSRFGFTALVERGYPMLGALCAALLVLLCLPLYQVSSSSR